MRRAVAADRRARAEHVVAERAANQNRVSGIARTYLTTQDRNISTWGDMQDRSFTA